MQFGFEFHMASQYWLSWWFNLLPFFLTPCPIVAEHVIIALSATLLLYNVTLWVRFLRHQWLSKVFFFHSSWIYEQPTGHSSFQEYISNFPEAFHQSPFDSQVLTWIFMEDSTDALHSWGPHHDPYSYSLNSGREQFASVCTPTPAQHLSTYRKTIQFRSHPMALATPSPLFTGTVFWAFAQTFLDIA